MSDDYPDWNPRFVCFARAHGMAPQEALDKLCVNSHGSRVMYPFTHWNNARWDEFLALLPPVRHLDKYTRRGFCHAQYNRWLPHWVPPFAREAC